MFRIWWAVKLIVNFFGTTKTDSELFFGEKKTDCETTHAPDPCSAPRVGRAGADSQSNSNARGAETRLPPPGAWALAPGARNRAGAGAAAASPALNF